MKILHLGIKNWKNLVIIAIVLAVSLIPVFAQSETTSTIWFDSASYATKEMSCYSYETGKISGQEQKIPTITVTDPTANKYSASIDRVTVYVWSDSDRKVIQITAFETEVNSGIFKGTVTITEGQSTQNLIHVRDGDTITAKYTGVTPWSAGTQNQGVITTAFIGVSCPPLERVPASGINITDNKGNQQKTILVNKQIQIGSKLDNITIRNQTFAYIVQISDEHNNVESLSSVSGLLLPSYTFSPSVSWTPTKAGNYTVQVFVWQSINNPNSLSSPVFTDLTVWSSLSAYTKSTIRNTEHPQCQSGYELVIKSSNNSPACVKPEHLTRLSQYGWTIPNLKIIGDTDITNNGLSENDCGQFHTIPENKSNSKEIPVLILKQNSTGCAKVTFTVNFLFNNTNNCVGCNSQMVKTAEFLSIGKYNFSRHGDLISGSSGRDYTHSFQIISIPKIVDVSKYPIGSNFTAVFIIKPLPNATGFYDYSIVKPMCNAYPLVVDYNPDQVNSSDFSEGLSFMQNHPCVMGSYGYSQVQVAGIDYVQMKLD